jgi:hypothetical protein
MALEDVGSNLMLDALGVATTYTSLHDGFPGSLGNECTGGAPAYARIAAVWDAASGASMGLDVSTPPIFDIALGETVSAQGLASAASAGTIYGSADVTDEGPYGAQGTYEITALTVSIT